MFSLLVGGLALIASVVNAIPTISTKGSKFFTSDGKQFFIRGVAYQLSESDPLLDTNQCQMDAKLMGDLGANAIRVYHVNEGDHSGCMRAFSDAGVYLFVDLDTFNTMIDQDYSHWNETQQSAFQAVMDEFQQYDNTAGFFIGNEAIRDGQHSQSAIYVKAATRDLKAYRQQKGYRDIPVGYSHADISSLRPNLQNYLACGTNASESIDFFGLNAYEWCGASSFSLSGYSTLENQAKGYPVPIFLSETGCNQPEPRDFQDQTAIFGPEMDQDWSGAIIYEWINEGNGYGLVAYDSSFAEGTSSIAPTASIPRSGTPTPVTPDYSNLKKVWASATPNSIGANAYNPNLTPPPCPASTPGIWEINGQASLPAVGQDIQQASQTAGTVTFSYAPLHPDSTSPSFPFSTFTDLSTLCPNGYIFAGNGSLEQVNPVENKTILLSSITGSAPSQTGTPGAASGGKEIATMSIGLVSVMLGFIWWL